MSGKPFEEAMERVERALLRIERAVERGAMHSTASNGGRDEQLRGKVRDALAELDMIIRDASHG
jgi:hypothetical protein